MSTLKNAISLLPMQLDSRIAHKIIIKATVEIGRLIREQFKNATIAVARQLELENKDISICNCIFTNSNEITFVLDDDELGLNVHFLVFPIHNWSSYINNPIKILACIIEEFAHYYWLIENEYTVCLKVHEITKQIYPNIQITDLYNQDWLDRHKPQ